MGVDKVRLIVPFDPEFEGLKKYHLNELTQAGDRILPSVRGVATKRNIEGRVIIHKDLEKEPRSWSVLWLRNQFCGRGETRQVEDYVTRTQMCFPRTIIPAEGIELILSKENDELRIGTDSIDVSDEERLLVSINVMLEIFGSCWVIDPSKAARPLVEIRRVNWRMLPPGQQNWEDLEKHVRGVMKRRKTGDSVLRNLERFQKAGCDQVVVGQGGFEDYVGFIYTKKKMVVLESVKPNNATYIFGQDWEALTKLSKGELIDGNLHQDRLIHNKHWVSDIDKLLGEYVA